MKSLNDRQIASTYGTCDIERMREADHMKEPDLQTASEAEEGYI
jgi:hypothetical protein